MNAKFEGCEHWINLDKDLPFYNNMNTHTDKVSECIKKHDEVKDLSNQQSDKDFNPINSNYESSNRKKKSKPRRVSLRKDVVNKGIIRGLNRFYNRLFRFKTNYKGKTRDTLYNQFASHVIQVLGFHQANGDLSNVVGTNGKSYD